jgi:hypothetical protein
VVLVAQVTQQQMPLIKHKLLSMLLMLRLIVLLPLLHLLKVQLILPLA